jgi:hypothetical protein
MYFYCYILIVMYALFFVFCSIVLFCVLFVCIVDSASNKNMYQEK